MNSPWTKAAAALLLAAASCLVAPACAENESSLFIQACLVPDEQCIVEPSADAVVRQRGLVDVAHTGGGYRCNLLLGNQLAPLGNDSLRTETSRIQIEAFDVTVRRIGPDGTEVEEAAFSAPTAGFVDPGQAPSPGYAGVDALLLDPATASRLADPNNAGFLNEVVVEVVARGRTLGGTEIESAPFRFPITVCNGCTCDQSCEGVSDAKFDCQFGLDGHCRFVDTACQ